MKKDTAITKARDALVNARDKLSNAEQSYAAATASRPDEWRAGIDAIEDAQTRIKTACIVWWDHFGTRPADKPWKHLDDLKYAWKPSMKVSSKQLKAALLAVGYLPEDARRRAIEAGKDGTP